MMKNAWATTVGLGLAILISLPVTTVPGHAQITASESAERDAAKHRVIPRDSNIFGNTYGEWTARWWQWALSVPEAINPVLDPTGEHCGEGQSGPVWFLAGTFGGPAVTRTCTVSSGKALFFPVLTAIFGAGVGDCAPTAPGVLCNFNTLRAAAAAAEDDPKTLTASIDGVPVRDLKNFRVQSPELTLTLPEGAVFGLPPGTFTPNVSDGYWLMIAPLSPGEHTIHFKGVANNDFQSEVTYQLHIVGKRDTDE